MQRLDAAVAAREVLNRQHGRPPACRERRDRPRSPPGWRAPRRRCLRRACGRWPSTRMRSETFITSRMSCSTSTTVMPSRAIAADERVDLGGLDRIAAGGRLVEQQHLGLARERAGDLEPLERAVGQAAGRPLGRCRQPDARQQRAAAASRVARFCRATAGRCRRSARMPVALVQVAADHDVLERASCGRRSAGSGTCATGRAAPAARGASPVTSSPASRTLPCAGA